MGTADRRTERSDAQVAEEILRQKVLSAGQLKAALDYQASVGGRLIDVLKKLGLVQPDVLEGFLERLAKGDTDEETESPARGRPEAPAPLSALDLSKLRVHKKLLEKLPREHVERHGILFFFPPPGTRAILMSSEAEFSREALRKLQDLLGVEIRQIDLPAEARETFIDSLGGGRDEPARPKGESGAQPRPRPEAPEAELRRGGRSREPPTLDLRSNRDAPPRPEQLPRRSVRTPDDDAPEELMLFRALIQLLIKKNVITQEELHVELELLKRQEAQQSRQMRNNKAQRLVREVR